MYILLAKYILNNSVGVLATNNLSYLVLPEKLGKQHQYQSFL